jgi:hypothetical protein
MEPVLWDSMGLPLAYRAASSFIPVASYFASLTGLISLILLRSFTYGTKTTASVESALSTLLESMEVTA